MVSLEEHTHVFIVRVWVERHETANLPAEYRGVVEHVMTQKRRFIRELDDILAFISPYVARAVSSASEPFWLSLDQVADGVAGVTASDAGEATDTGDVQSDETAHGGEA